MGDYDRLRPLSYPGTEVVVLCFSLVSESTFESIRVKWNPEVNHYLEDVPKILVGTKLDMREQKIMDGAVTEYEEITTEEGQELAKEIGAVAYIETSPLTGKNLAEVFEHVISAALAAKEADVPKKTTKSDKKGSEKKKRRSRREGEGEKKKRREKRKGETDEEKKERRRKRKEAKEGKGTSGTKKKREKTEGGEK